MRVILRIFRKIIKWLSVFLLCVLLIPAVAGLYVFSGVSECSKIHFSFALGTAQNPFSKKAQAIKATVPGYHRPLVSTFLTFPEWYIVYSSQEYAQVLEKGLPSEFPYFSAIGQFWKSYCYCNALAKKYPFNSENHVMIMVIGTSLTLEYIAKGIYENTIGRFSEWTSNHNQVQEDKYAYHVANTYGEFIPLRPWYEFTFLKSFKGLWGLTELWGENAFRKWERKFILSVEYLFKAFYAWGIELGTHATYGVAETKTGAWLNAPSHLLNKDIEKVASVDDKSMIALLPRYQPFTQQAIYLVENNATFIDIADNQLIMLSADVPSGTPLNVGVIVFSLKILIKPGFERIAVAVPVSQLHEVIKALQQMGGKVEHIYDY